MRIIFMGTPEFALPTLSSLIKSGYDVVACYTQMPKPAGRGKKVQFSPVHMLAMEHAIEVVTPINFKNKEDIDKFKSFNADITVVAAYGLILPREILDSCPYGFINIHPSLLPRWRGAAPIERAIMSGDNMTGVCIMKMNEKLDEGNILIKREFEIAEDMNAGFVRDTLARMGAMLTIEALKMIRFDEAKEWKQPEDGVTYAKKISKKETKIDWSLSAREVSDFIRGLSPYPNAHFTYNGEIIKIIEARYNMYISPLNKKIAGEVIDDHLTILCGDGVLIPTKLQRAGKNPLSREDFLRGFPIPKYSILSK